MNGHTCTHTCARTHAHTCMPIGTQSSTGPLSIITSHADPLTPAVLTPWPQPCWPCGSFTTLSWNHCLKVRLDHIPPLHKTLWCLGMPLSPHNCLFPWYGPSCLSPLIACPSALTHTCQPRSLFQWFALPGPLSGTGLTHSALLPHLLGVFASE